MGQDAEGVAYRKAVGLTLDHAFSCAVVKVSAGNGFTTEGLEAANVSVKLNQAVCQATLNLQDGSVTPGTQKESVSFLRGKNNEFKALVIPQSIPQADNLFTVTIDGRDFNLKRNLLLSVASAIRLPSPSRRPATASTLI